MSPGAVVLDVEGTVGAIAHVHDVLFPYARERLPRWFAAHRGTARAAHVLSGIEQYLGTGEIDEAGAVAQLTRWIDEDVKAPPLKTVQGWIWAAGYADGSLTSHVYAEVPRVLRRWRAAGVALYIYSSGPVTAQESWFAHTPSGDLTPLLRGYFDLVTAGSKKSPDSYRRISEAIGTPPDGTLFLSDSAEELAAAEAAGWHTAGVRRPDDPRPHPIPGRTTVRSLDERELDQLMR
ncbi:enolase-phosphatase E1 [Streptomyces sp. NBRC 110611]|uniref:acireductone synthase n=1 Tax=Streptomyces sp. NBRC 110611 TaxID=1621259 RepID=UPI00082B069E|nr:acireductone synthase [Streptomyces sp. NBRC 110611]GAU65774.1 enolase-phosphatase E1 [Streptomyces sp. NBRC 110611]